MSKMIECEKCGSIVTPEEARNIKGYYYRSNLDSYKDQAHDVDLCRECYEKIFRLEEFS